jgi:ABC-2 type transport system permease protein
VLPLALFETIGHSNKADVIPGTNGLKFITFFMVSMAGYGAMIGALAGGARIAAERSAGWSRLLRLTPLKPRNYLIGKVLTAYVMSCCSVALLFIAGSIEGVRIDGFGRWAEMTGLILLGILPFIALGIIMGHKLSVDTMSPALGIGAAIFAVLGGMWGPGTSSGTMRDIGEWVPSYWIAQASHVGVGGDVWGSKGWLVVLGWSLLLGALAAQAFRRDTQRV